MMINIIRKFSSLFLITVCFVFQTAETLAADPGVGEFGYAEVDYKSGYPGLEVIRSNPLSFSYPCGNQYVACSSGWNFNFEDILTLPTHITNPIPMFKPPLFVRGGPYLISDGKVTRVAYDSLQIGDKAPTPYP